MPLTLLQIIQRAQGELGLPQASTVVGNSDATTTQMFALANRCLDELRRVNRWTAQQFEYDLVVNPPVVTTGDLVAGALNRIINVPSTASLAANYWTVTGDDQPVGNRVLSVDSATQVTTTMQGTAAGTGLNFTFAQDTYPIPEDFDYFNNRTMWDRTNQWELLGPDSPQMDQWHRSGIVTTGPRRHYRKIGPYANTFRIWPQPVDITSPLQLVFEYLSLNAVMVHGSHSVFAQYFENDDDQPTLDDQAVLMGVKWMFWEAKGFGYLPMQSRWVDYVDQLAARDGAAPTLNLAKRVHPVFISPANVQDGFWPGPTGSNSA